MLTGQVILRDTGPSMTNDNRRLMIVAGIVAVDPDFDFLGESQYVITGDQAGNLILHKSTKIDRTKEASGKGIDGLLKSTIWRH